MENLYEIYLEQAKLMHQNPKYWKGHMIKKYMPQIEEVIKEHNIDTNSILDYGCGKAQHHPENWNAYKYDPAFPKYEKKPEAGRKFDLVICIDVLEHIPQADLPRIVKEIFDYSGKYVFATAATSKAGKTLPNGMNAHATVQPEEWWNELFAQYYEDPYKKFTLDFTTKKTKRNSSDIYNL